MPTFQEIAMREEVPVIHACRKDGATVLATRVPLRDVPSERWGWILSVGMKDEVVDIEDIDALYDSMGRRYPKVYLRSDMVSYIDRWECHEWEFGYVGSASQLMNNEIVSMNAFKDEVLNFLTSEQNFNRKEQIDILNSLLDKKSGHTNSLIEQNYKNLSEVLLSLKDDCKANEEDAIKFSEIMRDNLQEAMNNAQEKYGFLESVVREQIQEATSSTQEKYDSLESSIRERTQEMMSNHQVKYDELGSILQRHAHGVMNDTQTKYDALELVIQERTQGIIDNNQTMYAAVDQKLQENFQEISRKSQINHCMIEQILREEFAVALSLQPCLESLKNKILAEVNEIKAELKDDLLVQKERANNMQSYLCERIDSQYDSLDQELNKRYNKSKELQDEMHSNILDTIKKLQNQMSDIQNCLIPIEIDETNSNMDEEIAKIAKNAKTMSEKYMTSIINTNTRYYNTVDREVKEGNKQTKNLIYVGIVLLIITVISLLVTYSFHSNELTIITSGVGTTLAAIATAIGGLNRFHDKTAIKQLDALGRLNHTVQATHAQFVIEQVKDEDWKKVQLARLLDHYLTKDSMKK